MARASTLGTTKHKQINGAASTARPDRVNTKCIAFHTPLPVAQAYRIAGIRQNVPVEMMGHIGMAATLMVLGEEIPAELMQKLRDSGYYDRFRKVMHLKHA